MAAKQGILTKKPAGEVSTQLDPSQTLRAATALLRKIQSDQATRKASSDKTNLLADADEENEDDEVAVWLVLTTKKHIIDRQRLKPGKIVLPHPYLDIASPNLRICLITADPQRTYKDLVSHPSFPLELSQRIGRVIGLAKLKAKYKTFELKRQLLSEYDVFLADDRIITSLPQVLGKVFYKTGAKRPIPIDLLGKRQNFDDQGNKRRKLAEGGSKVTRSEVKPTDVAHEVQRAISSALVHLMPSTTTAVKVGKASMEPEQLQENVEAVVAQMVERYVPQKWNNVRSIHVKGPETAALPIWVAEELWADEKDVLEEPRPAKESKNGKKRQRDAIGDAAPQAGAAAEVADTADSSARKSKKRKSDVAEDAGAREAEKAEKKARKAALQEQKAAAKSAASKVEVASEARSERNGDVKKRRTRATASELI